VPEFKNEKDKNWWYQTKQIAKSLKPPNHFPMSLEKYETRIPVPEVKNYVLPKKCPDLPLVVNH
tara:strand:- start:530 stop:721 length:192 start_codon:yes stop_codon:yes gene_type:complete